VSQTSTGAPKSPLQTSVPEAGRPAEDDDEDDEDDDEEDEDDPPPASPGVPATIVCGVT
jgi:hypothetical protein